MSLSKKKIVVMIDWFAPGYKAGGPIQSCVNFCLAMTKDYQIYVVTTDTDLHEEKSYPGIVINQWTTILSKDINVYYFSKDKLTNVNLLSVLREIAPDYLYLNHVFSFRFVIVPLLLWWSGRLKTKIVLCPRGALYDSALHHQGTYVKKLIFLSFLRFLRIYKDVHFQATNDREREAIKKYFVTDKITVANNFSNPSQDAFEAIIKKNGSLKLVYIARILPIKNLLYVLHQLQNVNSNVVFTIVGPIEDMRYWEDCNYIIKLLPTHILVNYLGPKANHDLPEIIRNNHLYVLASEGENFGHSIFESFLSGRPVIISDQTPWRHLEEKKIGWDIALKNMDGYVRAIESAASWTQEEFENYGMNAWVFAHNFNNQSINLVRYKQLFA